DGSPQLVEPHAVIMTFEAWPHENLNVVSDSQYVCKIVQRLDRAVLKEVNNRALFHLLKALCYALQCRTAPFYILHVRSHANLPGFIVEGNTQADMLTAPARAAPVPGTVKQAVQSYSFFHQGVRALQYQFNISSTAARDIAASCSDCQQHIILPTKGVNPRGLQALQIWQSDVTHLAQFGPLKYVHVSVDTFSKAFLASAHAGERARDVVAHWCGAFAALGIPAAIKTDNGPGYTASQTRQFLQLWGVQHITGIPHSPTGQAIVECAHQSLKVLLEKQ
ncbi:hypothetical protein M959_10104, partial [Chaetura pelagica]